MKIGRADSLNDAEAARWEGIRCQGKSRFIWTQGVLRWGGVMFAFSLGLFQHAHYGSVFSLEGRWEVRVFVALLTWIFVGYGYGRSSWNRMEARYQTYLSLKGRTRLF
ncbi:MAG TPA: hypothetical protein DCY52_01920 [Methylococcaceae bacterium]|nr:hypothetical protein [Methylococcaceae bacterium]